MEIVMLVGGKGTRLKDLVKDVPKPMIDIKGRPFLEYPIDLLKKQGFTDFLLICAYKADVIKNYFNYGEKFGINIDYSINKLNDYGIGGNLVSSLEKIKGEEFMVVNGDTIFNIDLNLLIKKHKEKKAKNSIALKRVSGANRSGVVKINEDKKITHFGEKEIAKEEVLINGGIYILNKNDLEKYEKNKFILLEEKIFQEIELHGFEMKGKFIDIGTPESYREFLNNPYKYMKVSEK